MTYNALVGDTIFLAGVTGQFEMRMVGILAIVGLPKNSQSQLEATLCRCVFVLMALLLSIYQQPERKNHRAESEIFCYPSFLAGALTRLS